MQNLNAAKFVKKAYYYYFSLSFYFFGAGFLFCKKLNMLFYQNEFPYKMQFEAM